MIPHRIRLAGFLSYKQEQEVRFEGASLWMLSGSNGSGKSSIFDAVTYALFGYHRGGSSQAAELVNKDSTTLEVEFDFTIDNTLFRIKRTLKKLASGNKSTFQVFRSFSGTTEGRWEPVPDTASKRGFEEWISHNIGLNFETFTSSVLLLQGKAEKLLDSTPSGRAGVLASIVDLERYQKLHAKVDERRKERKTAQEALQAQHEAIRDVSDDEYAVATLQIDNSEALRENAQARLGKLQGLELQAGRWMELQARLTSLRDRLAADQGLLGQSTAIEKQHLRYQELRDVLPTIGTIITERGRVLDSERKSDRHQKDLAEHSDRHRQLDHDLSAARAKLTDLKSALIRDETKTEKLKLSLRELTGVLEQVRLVEDQESELKQFEAELARLPADAETRVHELQEKLEHLSLTAQALPSLIRIADERAELAQALTREKEAKGEEARLREEGTKAKAESDAQHAKLVEARAQREEADAAASESRALHQQAVKLAEEFLRLGGQKSCQACGQPLTEEHFEKEKKDRNAALRKAETQLKQTAKESEEKRKAEASATSQESEGKRKLDELRERFRDRTSELKQIAQDIRRLTDSIRDAYLATPEPFRSRVSPVIPADWTKVPFPARDELASLRREAEQLDALRRQLLEAQTSASRWQTLNVKTQTARERLDRLRQGLPKGDPVELRQKFSTHQAEETSLTNAIKAGKKAIHTTEAEVDRLQKHLSETNLALVALDGEIRNEENSRTQSYETIARLGKALPDPWQRAIETAGLSEQLSWKEEFEGLQAQGIEGKYARLRQALGGLERLRTEIADLENESTAMPEEVRRSPEVIRKEIAMARADLDACDQTLLEARQTRAVFDSDRKRRADLADQVLSLAGEHVRYKTLAELLGRDRLQRHLVRRAERQIVDYANAMLDRLSGGQLFLRVVDADAGTDKALDLECYNRVTGGSPINVAFLSGSQRFRVAVSLALGIGQYASTQHRPIECVIIDEGFGCLDRIGRQVMVQELQNLRGHLRCILLVSHQEEFAEAFPDGYRFELQNGSTCVTRRLRR